jgi:hypothetical protein
VTFPAIGPGVSHPRLLAVAQRGGLFLGAWFAWIYAAEPSSCARRPPVSSPERNSTYSSSGSAALSLAFLIPLATSLADFSEIIRAALLAAWPPLSAPEACSSLFRFRRRELSWVVH